MATEKRLIDLDKLVSEFMGRKVVEVFPDWESMSEATHAAVIRFARKYREIILQAPTVDAVEVVHGRWVDRMVRDWRCSECGEQIYKVRHVDGYCFDDKPNYCPNCGAKMDLEV